MGKTGMPALRPGVARVPAPPLRWRRGCHERQKFPASAPVLASAGLCAQRRLFSAAYEIEHTPGLHKRAAIKSPRSSRPARARHVVVTFSPLPCSGSASSNGAGSQALCRQPILPLTTHACLSLEIIKKNRAGAAVWRQCLRKAKAHALGRCVSGSSRSMWRISCAGAQKLGVYFVRPQAVRSAFLRHAAQRAVKIEKAHLPPDAGMPIF